MSNEYEERGEDRLRRQLLAGSADQRERAAAEIRLLLLRYARTKLADAGHRVHTDPESLVQSVLRAIDRDAEETLDDDHLLARLRTTLWHKFLDRRKAAKNGLAGLDDGGRPIDPADASAGPSTILDIREHEREADEKFLRFVATLDAAAPSDRVRDVVEHSIIRGRPWREIEAILGVDANTLKVALSRARPTLLAAILEPLRPRLSPEDWAVAEAILLRRLDPTTGAELLGLQREALLESLAERVLPAFHDAYGPLGADRLNALTGWVR